MKNSKYFGWGYRERMMNDIGIADHALYSYSDIPEAVFRSPIIKSRLRKLVQSAVYRTHSRPMCLRPCLCSANRTSYELGRLLRYGRCFKSEPNTGLFPNFSPQ